MLAGSILLLTFLSSTCALSISPERIELTSPSIFRNLPNRDDVQGGCGPCDYGKVWNDVIFLLDASENSHAAGLTEMWGLVQSMTPWFNVQNTSYTSTNYSMRVGAVSYASKATVLFPLGSVNQTMINDFDIPYQEGDTGTDIASALQLAIDEFASPSQRTNARKVIVILAKTFISGNYFSPEYLASKFKSSGGVIIVYEDVEDTGFPSQELRDLASTGYLISSLNSTMDTMLNAQCDANCFCPTNFVSFADNARGSPTAGCHRAVDVPANFHVARRNCQTKFNNGYISSETSKEKSNFLADTLGTSSSFYLGLVFDAISSEWIWEDGTKLSSESYQNWYSGSAPSKDVNGSCVYENNEKWIPTDCRNGFEYICESQPCDTTHYCSFSEQ